MADWKRLCYVCSLLYFEPHTQSHTRGGISLRSSLIAFFLQVQAGGRGMLIPVGGRQGSEGLQGWDNGSVRGIDLNHTSAHSCTKHNEVHYPAQVTPPPSLPDPFPLFL